MVSLSNYLLPSDAHSSRLNQLLQWIDAHGEAMLSDPQKGLEAIGVGKKNSDRLDAEADWSLVGFVSRKLPTKEMADRNLTDFSLAARSMAADVDLLPEHELDVVECGSSFQTQPGLSIPDAQRGKFGGPPPSVDLQKPFDSIRVGVGITNPVGSYPNSLGVGTLGFCVRDDDERTYLVSNNHVIGRENAAQTGNAIVQPGTLDLTSTELSLMNTLNKLRNALTIAKVSAVVDIDFTGLFNEVDVAIAEFEPAGEIARDLSQLSRIGLGSTARGVAAPYTIDANGSIAGDTRVYKAGRTTGWTEGAISALGVLSNVTYSKGNALFRNQLAITPSSDNSGPFSDPGDSGSGIWNTNNELVGLLFAGSSTRTLANPIDLVWSALEAELGRGPLTLII